MDLVRLVKLKMINGELENLNVAERHFISILGGLKNLNTSLIDEDIYGADRYIDNQTYTMIAYQHHTKLLYFTFEMHKRMGEYFEYNDSLIDEFFKNMINNKLG